MGEGPSTLAKATATLGHPATEPVTLTTTDPLLPGHLASASAEELVAGVPRAPHGPTSLPQAAREYQREDVLLQGGQSRPQRSHHQARYSWALPWRLRGGAFARRMGLSFCFPLFFKIFIEVQLIYCVVLV